MVLVGLRTSGATLLAVMAAGALASVARAGDVREPLPFVADEASYPRGRPPPLLWPEREWPDDAPGTDLVPEDGDVSRIVDPLPVVLPAFPDVTRLLGPIPELRIHDEGVVVHADDHPERGRIANLLAAARTGYARSIRVEIVVARPGGAAEPRTAAGPTADELLAAGDVLRIDTTTRAGALVLDDARRDATLPARAYVSTSLVTPDPVVFRVGPRVAFTVTPMADDVLVLDLDLNVSRAVGPVTLDEPAVRRVAPILDVLALRAAIPLTNGRATRIELPGALVAVRVTREPRALPDGIAVLAVPAFGRALPDARPFPSTPRPLLTEDDSDQAGTGLWDGGDRRVRVVPDAWFDAAKSIGVRAVPLPPALVVVEGAPEGVARFGEAVASSRTVEAWRVAAPGVDLPVVAGTSWTCAAGRMEPLRNAVESDASWERAVGVSRVSYRVLGSFVHGRGDGARVHIELDTVAPGDDGPAGRPIPLGSARGAGPEATVLDASTVRTARSEATLAPGDPAQHGISVERIEVGR